MAKLEEVTREMAAWRGLEQFETLQNLMAKCLLEDSMCKTSFSRR